jgi:hypothetical protein
MKIRIAILVVLLLTLITLSGRIAAADASIWLWGFAIGQPYADVEEQLKAFDNATDTESGGKLFIKTGEWKRDDKVLTYSLSVDVEEQRIATILLQYDGPLSDADSSFLLNDLLDRLRYQGLVFEESEGNWMCAREDYVASVWASDGTVSAMLMSTIEIETAAPSSPQAEEPSTGIKPSEARSLIKKSRAFFKKYYSEDMRLQSAHLAQKIEYGKYGKGGVYSESTLDQRFAVVKYSRTRRASGLWCWRFVRATELDYTAPDRIVAVEVWRAREYPVSVRDLDSHMYIKYGGSAWSYTDPSLYVEWWTYISFLLFQYPMYSTVYFSYGHPGILDASNSYYGNGTYRFTAESIEYAGVIASLDL